MPSIRNMRMGMRGSGCGRSSLVTTSTTRVVLERGRGVDRDDARVCVRAAQDRRVQRARALEVVDEAASAGEEPTVLLAPQRAPDDALGVDARLPPVPDLDPRAGACACACRAAAPRPPPRRRRRPRRRVRRPGGPAARGARRAPGRARPAAGGRPRPWVRRQPARAPAPPWTRARPGSTPGWRPARRAGARPRGARRPRRRRAPRRDRPRRRRRASRPRPRPPCRAEARSRNRGRRPGACAGRRSRCGRPRRRRPRAGSRCRGARCR